MCRMNVLVLAIGITVASCQLGENEVAVSDAEGRRHGALVSIGGLPTDLSIFSRSDCGEYGFSDCSAQDDEGWNYAFFDGGLARVSLKRADASPRALLPAGMRFGESIDLAGRKAEKYYGFEFDRGEIEGRIVYSSDFVIRSTDGTLYSLELLGDKKGTLDEVIERTDF